MEKRKMKVTYEDYLLMVCDEEERGRTLKKAVESMQVTFMEYFDYMLCGGFAEIEKNIFKGLKLKKWLNYTDDDIIDCILSKTNKDRSHKKKERILYCKWEVCNGYA